MKTMMTWLVNSNARYRQKITIYPYYR